MPAAIIPVSLIAHLPNDAGAKGFIDILARDRLGHIVVIELKRSDQAARAALHELHKYVALLKAAHGVEAHQIRCMVCSTHWHELLVPFSEYARTVAYPVEGREMELDAEGLPIAFRPVTLVADQHGLQLCPHHVVLLFENGATDRQAEAAALVAKNFVAVGVKDFLLVLLSNEANGAKGIATHAVYVAVGELSIQDKARLSNLLDAHAMDDGDDDGTSDESRWRWEDAVIERATTEVPRDQFEIGYPEKFMKVLDEGGVES